VEDGLQPGDVVAGKLEVIRKIGGGGMGAVYEVEHKLTKHRRALKVLHKSQALNRRYVERLLREASVAGRLDTPHVVETLDAGMLEDGAPYVLMELLRGRALLELIEREAPLDAVRMVRIIRQICDGMQKAHDAGIIHRDLKPENILVEEGADGQEQVKIIDFGISHFRETETGGPVSRLTTEGTIIGTPYYMSPEQASGKDVDHRTDIYALGVILYEALTGRLPFIAETTGALFIKIGTGEYLPLRHRRRDIDAGLADAVERAFHKDPAERYATARELSEALAPYAVGPVALEKPRRATADYESDPPRAGTRPGVAPESVETMDVEVAMAAATRSKVAVIGGAPITSAPSPVRVAPPRDREAPTEELGGAPVSEAARGGIPDTRERQLRLARASGTATAADSDPPAPRRIPQWVGTTSIAAIIAAVVAVTIVGISNLGASDPEEVTPPPVTERPDERPPSTDMIEVTDPVVTETTESGVPSEAASEADTPVGDESERPSMMRTASMNGMQTPAEAAGLERDPYGP
jgi:tRNA A-37 threonylcarbamoyl transferase component Bud32